ncbi:MAG TPA: carbohydrate-binding family 9-like protein [Myxococcaceae bacterium]|nr:carbohydrate-binding family 9-like protein [Myxococcaceae bacterium]
MRFAPSSLLLVLALLGPGCRDEQAGPRPRARAPASSAAEPSSAVQGTWAGGAIKYLGTQVERGRNERGQDAVRLTHRFEATRRLEPGWQIFVHLVDARTGQMLANADHPPPLPLEQWPVGQPVQDVQILALPQGAPEIQLLLGFWHDDQRLPVDQPTAQDGQQRMRGPLVGGGGPAVPEAHVRRTAMPPKIDGVLDEAAWRGATPLTLVDSLDGRPAAFRTTARLAWDDEALYVAFECEDPDVWGTFSKRDEPLYTQEVVEIFLDADADGRTYDEIEVSPHNVVFDAYFPARRQGMDLSWDSGLQSAVKVSGTIDDASDRDQGWTVEMRIPFARLHSVPHLPPKPGDRWRFNLYRLELPDRKQAQGQAFSPLYVGDFHAVDRFAWLVFDER